MRVDEFIAKWTPSGGNERANTQLFVADLCDLLDLPRPEPTQPDSGVNDYVFERHVIKNETGGGTSNGWIDLYKRDCFIFEAKQGSDRDIAAVDTGLGESLRDLFGQTAQDRFKRGMAKRGTGQWASAMQRAAGQAEGYARALPKEHGWPPFLLVSDVGYCIDVYANFARDGRSYAPFPDRRKFRIELKDLADEQVRKRLRAIWLNPMSLDPAAEAARVTRDVATHLAALAKDIEAREQNADRVAAFLMRLLFTMFAEDTGLIPKKSFSALLRRVRDRPENLKPQLSQLWAAMDTGGLAFGLGETGETVRRFNGYLFKDTTAIDLTSGEIEVLIEAAGSDWRQVEPAIFGTLLERALNVKERAKLGAHYTPRAYVERLVQPTIMEPLREDWLGARTAASEAAEQGDKAKARRIVEEFHGKLVQTKVLDPACGTGNFLYVAMARMKELEGEVLELLEELGDRQYLAEISGHTITPENFLGIEINPRAAEIAQLVLWIGYLQWHFRVNGEERMPEPPVLRDVKTIENRDALIAWDRKELERDQYGHPVSRWDGETMKPHPVTGKPVPDESARLEVYRYINPRAAKWPKADFIIGNPPFIGNKRMRERLSDGYVEAIRRAHPEVPGSVDLVMFWWDAAARRVSRREIRRFGLITSGKISQPLNRGPIERMLLDLNPGSIVFAIPDHPWWDPQTDAAVRVAFTIGTAGRRSGESYELPRSSRRKKELSETDFVERRGTINADLTVGPDLPSARELRSNRDLAQQGVILVGEGFRTNRSEAQAKRLLEPETAMYVRPYIIGEDLTERRSNMLVIDTYGLSENDLRGFPHLYSFLHERVLPERQTNNDKSFRENWWLWGRPRPIIRKLVEKVPRYIATCRTSVHRTFAFENVDVVPDAKVVFIGLHDGYDLGVLSSFIHVHWATRIGAWLGAGNDSNYNHSDCFNRFPFPDTSNEALKHRIRDAAEKLDALRKQVLEAHPDLTLTKLYNVLEALRAAEASGGVLGDKDRDIATRGCVTLIRHYHDEIDAGVAEAYGWGDLLTCSPAKAGAQTGSGRSLESGEDHASASLQHGAGPLPSQGNGVFIPGADEIILERLVALNKERAAEEAKGKVRWLRPEYQAPGYVAPQEQVAMALAETGPRTAEVLQWPAKLPEQVVAVAGIVERAGKPVAANDVARAFGGKRAASVAPVLDALAGMGRLRKLEDGRFAA